jgi:class 3 adenylate cyclase
LLPFSQSSSGKILKRCERKARRQVRPRKLLTTVYTGQRIGALDPQAIEPIHSSIRELMVPGESARIGGARPTITVLFTDIAGFTSVAESMAPEALTAHMAEYFEEMMGIVQGDGFGTVTQITGDGPVAFWGAPASNRNNSLC